MNALNHLLPPIGKPAPVTHAELLTMARISWRTSPLWWERRAAIAVDAGRFFIIDGRNDRNVYVCRIWLAHEPEVIDRRIESGNQTLLHYFARGDDDRALHDHPWPFETSILAGGYFEHLPPPNWDRSTGLGPDWDAHRLFRGAGETIAHRAEDLHCVGDVVPGTWTLVSTGKRTREWGFHPPGKRWVSQDEFLRKGAPPASPIPLKTFQLINRVVVIEPGHPLEGWTGTIWRRRVSDNGAWITMDRDLPEQLQSFDHGDNRYRNVLLYPHICAEELR